MSESLNSQTNPGFFDLRKWQNQLLRTLLLLASAIGLVSVVLYLLTSGSPITKIIACVFYGILLVLTFVRINYLVRALFFLALIFSVALLTIMDKGLTGGGPLFMLGWITISVLILSPLAGWISTGVSIVSIAVIGWLFSTGTISPWTISTPIIDMSTWVQNSAYLLLLAIITILGISKVINEFATSRDLASTLISNLRSEESQSKARVEETTAALNKRTEELEKAIINSSKRASQFEAISRTLSSVASYRSLDTLLPRLSVAISEQFGFYHVGVFLNDLEDIFAVLRASNSPGGKVMLSHNHRLKVGQQGMVGYVTQTGLPRIALDVGTDAAFFDNPDLSDTRSEMTLPLKIGEKTIGALDVQSKDPFAFTDEDIHILTALANQVGLAIENARLFEQTSRSLAEAEAISRQYLGEGWGKLAKEGGISGYRSSVGGAVPIASSEEAHQADPYAVNIPIILRGERVGTLSIKPADETELSPDQLDIARAISDRVALSGENARLFEEVSRRAERERMVSQITTNIRSTSDPQNMIFTALNELKRALGVDDIEIRPYRPPEAVGSETNLPPSKEE